MSVSTSFKPSPLGYGSSPTRSSPFRRPESPVSPSPLRYSTPTQSPTKGPRTPNSARFGPPITPSNRYESRNTRGPSTASPRTTMADSRPAQGLAHGNALSQLQASQVRTLRDSFQILDRDCDGVVNREDVADMLSQLGLPSGQSDVAPFFPPSKPQTMPLAAFLNSLAEVLAALSPSNELLSAFSAFDDDDSGQIDWAELKDALVNTAPEHGERQLTPGDVDRVVNGFTGRRAFNRNMNAQLSAKRGDVFKYHEFVNSIMGANGGADNASRETAEA